jgi:hypothetical protein
MQLQWNWDQDTSPFSTANGQQPQPALFKLRQVDDDDFELLEPFNFTCADGTTVIPVTSKLLGRTDLASIPTFLGWFARRHGRHTPAALLHDQLIPKQPEDLPEALRMPRADADRLFRDALRACGVALVKSWVLWTGVTLGTRLWSGFWRAAAIVAWFVAAMAGTVLLLYGGFSGRPALMAIALLAPVPCAVLWGRQWTAGLIAGYAFWPVAFGSLPPVLAYQLYRLVEHLARRLGQLRPAATRPPLPPSVPFSKR